MPVPSITVSFNDIQTEFGGTNPISLDEYYNISGKYGFNIADIPTSGLISLNHFRGKSNKFNVDITGTGNNINNVSDNSYFKYALFTNSGNFTINKNIVCDILIVGGGGGGGRSDLTDGNNGRYGGGGGGSGDVLYIENYTLNSGSYNINIGLGGSGGTGANNSANGGNSTITSNSSTLIGAGGGGGGADSQSNSGKAGNIITSTWGTSSGGGGGGGGNSASGGSGNTYSGNGANGTISGDQGGGGGGGPEANGSGINGGTGLNINITGSSVLYGGGAGGQRNYSWVPGSSGGNGYGSGGGTAQNSNGISGSKGVVIIRYTIKNFVSGIGNYIKNTNDNSNYLYAFFANSGTFTIDKSIKCDILIVGGGGGGFDNNGPGGGGGQVLYYTDNSVPWKTGNSITLNAGTYNINIGSGGSRMIYSSQISGTNGGTTTINLASTNILTAVGGAGCTTTRFSIGGNVGGCCGGSTQSGQSRATSSNGGGQGGLGSGGGGGGANITGTTKNGGDEGDATRDRLGGAGVDINITGTNIGVGGGGGGSRWDGGTYLATHGGGTGYGWGNGTNGKPNTGGGGSGGGFTNNLGDGGSGVVILRLPYPVVVSGSGNFINTPSDFLNYKYAFFANSGTFTIDSNILCNILIVGGGGGGGSRHAGGGGAGAVIYLTNQTLNSGTYTITIGSGGGSTDLDEVSSGQGGKGGDSIITFNSTNIYLAKGGGAGNHGASTGNSNRDGGSGGGGGDVLGYAVSTNIPSGTYGNNGGLFNGGGNNISHWAGGGGGGAASVGATGTYNGSLGIAGNGGNGKQISITGTNVYYGGGGGGGCSSTAQSVGSGGLGGGGAGSKGTATATSGTANTGGGGGGAGFDEWSNGRSGAGGSGVIIIRYLDENFMNSLTSLRRYPSKAWSSISSESNTTINGKSCRLVNINLDTTNISYGSGTYQLYFTTSTNDYQHNPFSFFNFDNDVNSAGGHTEENYNGSSGAYQGGSYLVESSYLGSWFVIKTPISILLTNYYIIYRNGLYGRSPKNIRLYGSNDGNNWTIIDDVQNITYNSSNIYNKTIININFYNYYGVVINSIQGGNNGGGICNFIEFVINGQETI